MTPTPEQIAAAVERLLNAVPCTNDMHIVINALHDAQKDSTAMTKDLVKYRLALNRIAHPVTYATTDADPREIARRAVLLGCQVDPLPDCYLRRAAISAAAGGEGKTK